MELESVLEVIKNRPDTAEFLISREKIHLRSQTEHNNMDRKITETVHLYYLRKLWYMLIMEYYAVTKDAFSKTLVAKLMCCELNLSFIFSKFSVR